MSLRYSITWLPLFFWQTSWFALKCNFRFLVLPSNRPTEYIRLAPIIIFSLVFMKGFTVIVGAPWFNQVIYHHVSRRIATLERKWTYHGIARGKVVESKWSQGEEKTHASRVHSHSDSRVREAIRRPKISLGPGEIGVRDRSTTDRDADKNMVSKQVTYNHVRLRTD